MQYVLYVFATRSAAMAFYDACLARHVRAEVTNTPREVSASCGISVRTTQRDYPRMRQVAEGIRGFASAYLVTETWTHHGMVRL